MNIKKIQQQAASCVDELLSISEDIGSYIVTVYGTVSKETFDVQCRIQLARCRRLSEKQNQLQDVLADLLSPSDTGSMSEEQQRSIAVTEQILEQNQIIVQQKQDLLNDFLTHSDKIQSHLDDSREMKDQAEIIQLQNTLRKELYPCRTEKEK